MRGKSIPEGFHTGTPYLLVDSVRSLIEFLSSAFNAEEIEISTHEDGTLNEPPAVDRRLNSDDGPVSRRLSTYAQDVVSLCG